MRSASHTKYACIARSKNWYGDAPTAVANICHAAHEFDRLPFEIDHIVSRKHGGRARPNNTFHKNLLPAHEAHNGDRFQEPGTLDNTFLVSPEPGRNDCWQSDLLVTRAASARMAARLGDVGWPGNCAAHDACGRAPDPVPATVSMAQIASPPSALLTTLKALSRLRSASR
jgi:hypothetical protein